MENPRRRMNRSSKLNCKDRRETYPKMKLWQATLPPCMNSSAKIRTICVDKAGIRLRTEMAAAWTTDKAEPFPLALKHCSHTQTPSFSLHPMSGVTWKHNVEEQKLGSWGRTKVLIGGEELQNVHGGEKKCN